MTDSKDLIERLRGDAAAYLKSVYDPDPEKVDVMFTLDYQWTDKPHRHIGDLCGKINEAADRIEKLEADNARLNDALRQAVLDAAEWARKAGEAQGKLEISEAAGILDGWIRDCKRLEADNARLRAALEGVLTGSTDIECGERVIYAGAVNAVRAALGETFEDLGQEFEAVWDVNRDKLYEGYTK